MKIITLNKNIICSKNIIKIIIITFIALLVLYSESNIIAINSSTTLFINKVFPSLFPFFIALNLLIHTNIISILDKKLSYIMIKLFNVSGAGSFPLIMGILSGYPSGAKIVSDYRKNNICSKNDCERLLAYTNNSGPLFIIGTVGTSMFLNKNIGIILLFIHIISSISVGIVFRFYKFGETRSIESSQVLDIKNFSQIITESIYSSIKTLIIILGYIILFSIIINMIIESNILLFLNNIPNSEYIKALLLGLLEITYGINAISLIKAKSLYYPILFTAFLLGTGGLSVFMQVYSIVSKTDLSIKPYIIGKILQGTFSVLYLIILFKLFPLFTFSI